MDYLSVVINLLQTLFPDTIWAQGISPDETNTRLRPELKPRFQTKVSVIGVQAWSKPMIIDAAAPWEVALFGSPYWPVRNPHDP
jgi:hypothetical protein